ncbi:MAG TPA: sulfite reductase flavoprotein subunit alpha [Candidatus Poseidoniales archaeon]|nr:MAG TPA: sulfite reductase flavoprotein subunit alpha [Candidatus Poseidoniales archaeon]|tara:strand:- start:1438 stop:3273 length:1836 start_codon:yes stop_codon:yes gene_type:complete
MGFDMGEPRSILILYGSQSGNCEDLANQAGKISSQAGLNPTVKAMDEIEINELLNQQRIIVCCSTWGDGEQPDNAEDLWEAANSGTIEKLEGVNFSVLALGDTSYDLFCESGKEWDKWFHSKGANRVHERVDCDVDYEEPAEAWMATVIPKMAAIEDVLMEAPVTAEIQPDVIIAEMDETESTENKKPQWSAKNPYTSNLDHNYVLNGEGSGKETRHIVFNLGSSELEYKAGDALGVIPVAPPDLVEDLLTAAGFDGSETVDTHLGEMELRQALTSAYEIHRLSKKWVRNLGDRLDTPEEISIRLVSRTRTSINDDAILMEWSGSGLEGDVPTDYYEIGSAADPALDLWNGMDSDDSLLEDYIWSRDYIDAISDFGHIISTPQQLVDGMDRLKPRLYSIASSPDHEPGTVHLTVGIVRYTHHDRDRTGLTTGFLADRCEVSETDIGIFMSPTRSFILPKDLSTDIIMVGPGTGIAPFRAFLQQRDIDGATGRNWLFFGDWTESGENYYKEEMDDWKERGILTKHDLAWSRDGSEKVYVQHLMKKHGEEIWAWIDGGAYFYVCGDKSRMAKDVHKTLIGICGEHGGMSEEDAHEFVENRMMRVEKRYLRDVY